MKILWRCWSNKITFLKSVFLNKHTKTKVKHKIQNTLVSAKVNLKQLEIVFVLTLFQNRKFQGLLTSYVCKSWQKRFLQGVIVPPSTAIFITEQYFWHTCLLSVIFWINGKIIRWNPFKRSFLWVCYSVL